MVKNVAHKNIWHFSNRAPTSGAVISAARVPGIRLFDVNLSSDVAVTHPASRHDRDRIRIVVNTFEVSVHLYMYNAMSDQFHRVSGTGKVTCCTLTLESNQLAQVGFPTLGFP